MRRLIAISLSTLALGLILAGQAQPQPADKAREENVSKFMRAKLTHSQAVLEGLAMEDYDQIAKSAQQMALLSQATSWQVLQTPEYMQQSADFRRTANSLTEAGKKKNLDGAALAFVELTLKCVNCHKYVRGVKVAKRDFGPRFNELQIVKTKATKP